eukprot:756884-Hanusia_phi.AAC.3
MALSANLGDRREAITPAPLERDHTVMRTLNSPTPGDLRPTPGPCRTCTLHLAREVGQTDLQGSSVSLTEDVSVVRRPFDLGNRLQVAKYVYDHEGGGVPDKQPISRA